VNVIGGDAARAFPFDVGVLIEAAQPRGKGVEVIDAAL
jgi:hypothetical protein